MSAGLPGDSDSAGERWRDAVAELEYAERHGAAAAEVEALAANVIAARIELFQTVVRGGGELPAFLTATLERDRQLLQLWAPQPVPAAPRVGDGR